MFTVNTPEGTRYMVVLTGPRSYRYGNMHVHRGGVLTVTKKTRDYLVKKTGFFSDYDPAPENPVEEIFPPQFGEDTGPQVEVEDFDMKTNPPLSQEQAMGLAAKGQAVDQNGKTVPVHNPADDEKGDLTSADLAGTPPKGGASAKKTATAKAKSTPTSTSSEPATKAGNMTIKSKSAEAEDVS